MVVFTRMLTVKWIFNSLNTITHGYKLHTRENHFTVTS